MNRRNFVQSCAGTLLAAYVPQGQDLEQSENRGVQVGMKSKTPAKRLFAFRLEELTSHSQDLRLTLHCLQGLVNREQPQLYLVQDRYDELWLKWLQERGDIQEVQWLEIGQLFDRFLPAVSSMFITDPAIPASVNVATMLAAVHGALVATPATARMFNLPAGAYPDSSKVGWDLRRMNWKKEVEAYRWAFAQMGDRLSRKAVGYLDPATNAIRDYFVEFKVPIVWISSAADESHNRSASYEEELAFARELFMKWPPNIPCLGWPGNGVGSLDGIGEWDGVRLASQCAKFEVCSAYDGYSPTVSNLSVHSGTSATYRQAIPPVRLGRDKVYYSFIRSDGDGLNFQRHYYRKLFDDPQHGRVPLGWHIGPTATDFIPDILDYYYKNARPGDCFVNALTGVGYIHEDNYADNFPTEQREQIWSEYLRLSSIYRARLDASVLSTFAEMEPERMARFAGLSGFQGIFANYGRTHSTTLENQFTLSAGKPVFRAINSGPGGDCFTPFERRNAENHMINEIRRWTPSSRPAFMHVFLANWLTHMEMVENIAKGLGPEYAAVRPDQLALLCQQAHG